MRRFRRFIQRPGRVRLAALSAVVLGLVLGASGAARAAAAELISDHSSVAPGATFRVAIFPQLGPGETLSFWAAGPSGARLTWTLPAGFTLGRSHWPPVEKFAADGAGRFQFARGTPMVQEITAAAGPGSPGPLTLSLTLEAQVCATTCRTERFTGPGFVNADLRALRAASSYHLQTCDGP